MRTPFMRVLRGCREIVTPASERRSIPARGHGDRRYAGRVSSRTGIVVALLAVLSLPPAAVGALRRKPVTVQHSRHLWATVNVCDPAGRPAALGDNTIGIRASMPGSADGREIMYMRFRVQFFKDVDQKWHNVSMGGDSGWQRVGLARYKARQSGRYFRFTPTGPTLLLRGKVNFEWRLRGNVVRTAAKLTTKGHKSTAGAYPAGFSEATCLVTK